MGTKLVPIQYQYPITIVLPNSPPYHINYFLPKTFQNNQSLLSPYIRTHLPPFHLLSFFFQETRLKSSNL
ncbi:hypothetical protein HanPI659440_Chr04g0179131 [Helianthus annuus]|nr:hypothetical protein HanPI659440_Chr04g0179131 [Helianthus annuus]